MVESIQMKLNRWRIGSSMWWQYTKKYLEIPRKTQTSTLLGKDLKCGRSYVNTVMENFNYLDVREIREAVLNTSSTTKVKKCQDLSSRICLLYPHFSLIANSRKNNKSSLPMNFAYCTGCLNIYSKTETKRSLNSSLTRIILSVRNPASKDISLLRPFGHIIYLPHECMKSFLTQALTNTPPPLNVKNILRSFSITFQITCYIC